MNRNSTTELKNCTFVKTLLMLSVVCYHAIVFWTEKWGIGPPATSCAPLGVLATWMNSIHVYGFALVSGYLFYHLKFERGKYTAYLPFLANKIKRLLVPYTFILAAWIIPINLIFFDLTLPKILDEYVLGKAPEQLWFLLMLFWVFAVFGPLARVLKSHTVLGFSALLILCILSWTVFLYVPSILLLHRVPEFLIIFFIGFKIRQFYDSEIVKTARKIPWVIFLAAQIGLFVLVGYVLTFPNTMLGNLSSELLLIFLHCFGAVMSFFVLQKLADAVKWDNARFLGVARCSMPIYLVHQQLIYFPVSYLDGLISPYLLAPITIIAVLVVSFFISTVLLKFKPTRFLIGEK